MNLIKMWYFQLKFSATFYPFTGHTDYHHGILRTIFYFFKAFDNLFQRYNPEVIFVYSKSLIATMKKKYLYIHQSRKWCYKKIIISGVLSLVYRETNSSIFFSKLHVCKTLNSADSLIFIDSLLCYNSRNLI